MLTSVYDAIGRPIRLDATTFTRGVDDVVKGMGREYDQFGRVERALPAARRWATLLGSSKPSERAGLGHRPSARPTLEP